MSVCASKPLHVHRKAPWPLRVHEYVITDARGKSDVHNVFEPAKSARDAAPEKPVSPWILVDRRCDKVRVFLNISIRSLSSRVFGRHFCTILKLPVRVLVLFLNVRLIFFYSFS